MHEYINNNVGDVPATMQSVQGIITEEALVQNGRRRSFARSADRLHS